MATKKKSDILKDVRVLLDEQRDNTKLIQIEDTVSVETNTILWSYIEQALDEVHLAAQSWMLRDIIKQESISITAGTGRKPSYGMLPTDFLRMIAVNADDWIMPCFDPIDQDSDEYQMQFSKWKGIKGNADRPMVAIVPSFEISTTSGSNTPSGDISDEDNSSTSSGDLSDDNTATTTASETDHLRLEVFTTTKNSVNLLYVQRAQITADTDPVVTIGKHCYRALLYTIGKYYLSSIGELEKAALFGATAGGILGTTEVDRDTEAITQ